MPVRFLIDSQDAGPIGGGKAAILTLKMMPVISTMNSVLCWQLKSRRQIHPNGLIQGSIGLMV